MLRFCIVVLQALIVSLISGFSMLIYFYYVTSRVMQISEAFVLILTLLIITFKRSVSLGFYRNFLDSFRYFLMFSWPCKSVFEDKNCYSADTIPLKVLGVFCVLA